MTCSLKYTKTNRQCVSKLTKHSGKMEQRKQRNYQKKNMTLTYNYGLASVQPQCTIHVPCLKKGLWRNGKRVSQITTRSYHYENLLCCFQLLPKLLWLLFLSMLHKRPLQKMLMTLAQAKMTLQEKDSDERKKKKYKG